LKVHLISILLYSSNRLVIVSHLPHALINKASISTEINSVTGSHSNPGRQLVITNTCLLKTS